MENPLPTELPDLLSEALLHLEAARRDASAREESAAEALEVVRKLEDTAGEIRSTELRERIARELELTRQALEESRADEARDRLLDVGRSMDRHVKEMRG